MKVKVINREDPGVCTIYDDVVDVVDAFNDNGNYCHQVQMKDGTTATYPASEWAFFSLEWTPLF